MHRFARLYYTFGASRFISPGALSVTSAAAAATLFVSPSGQAGAAGTTAAPFASLAEAASRAQPGDVIRLAGGTYRQDQPIRLVAHRTADAPICIEPADTNHSLPSCPPRVIKPRST